VLAARVLAARVRAAQVRAVRVPAVLDRVAAARAPAVWLAADVEGTRVPVWRVAGVEGMRVRAGVGAGCVRQVCSA
jgi:hypothetical protein